MMFKLFADFETYYDNEYSLRKMTNQEYIQSPQFEALGCGFALDDGRKWWVDGPDLPAFFTHIDWSDCFLVTHNALFDALILSLRYKVFPKMYGDTLGMGRNWVSHSTGSVSLATLAKYFGLPPKMDTLNRLKGVNFRQLRQTPALYEETKEYAIDDAGKCQFIYNEIMKSGFPPRELEVIDMVVRMAARPVFEIDQDVLCEHLAEVQTQKQELLENAQMLNADNLMSDTKFAGMLLNAGVTPPMKVSKTTGNKAWAFAKTDKELSDLLEHEDPYVQALVAARLGHKSTIEETRTQRFLAIARVSDKFPIPLKYSGAHTHRFSGDWKINAQNLQRGGKIRKSLRAPKGKLVVSVDASQIEARLNAVLSDQLDLVRSFALGNDVYAEFAETIYKHPVNKKEHPDERFVGKTGILSLGYGSGAPVFQGMCRNQGGVILPDAEAQAIVYLYRQRYAKIAENWQYADRTILPALATPAGHRPHTREWGPMGIEPNALVLPNGNRLRYRDLRHEFFEPKAKFNWCYNRGPRIYSIYGAKVVENACQALAFVHIMDVALRVKKQSQGLLVPAHQVHDELLYVVDESIAEQVRDFVIAEMSKSPVWMPSAPLAAEGGIGVTYLDTK
jgi:DNA polymerase I-like protein with 3'-5' exonuclease and polymerase domains